MGTLHYLRDSLVNFVTGLGTFKDPTFNSQYQLNLLNRNDLENAYRADWIARKIVDAPAEDATREWRSWQASNDQIEAIEDAEKLHKLQLKLKWALIRARLYGGAALVIGVDDGQDNNEPINFDAIKKGSLRFVVVMNRYELSAGPRIYNVDSPWYTRPEYYVVQTPLFGFNFEKGAVYPGQSTEGSLIIGQRPQGQSPLHEEGDRMRQVTPYQGMVQIHPSRVIEFAGNELPDWRLAPMGGGWGDSVLQTADDMLKDWGLTIGGIANMINDAKMDVIKIPDFSKNMATKEYAQKLLGRFMVANQSKSQINSILLDKEEDWDRVQTQFGGLPNLVTELMTVVAGAGNLPVSRLFGKAGAKGLGKSSSGQDELRNYYDGITSEQKTDITPRMEPLDQVLVRSALGKFDPNVHYNWTPLYVPEPKDLADIAKTKAETTQIYVTSGLINEDALRDAAVNQLVEDGTYPGLEDAIDEFGAEPDIVTARVWSPGYDPVTGKPLQQPATSSLPKKTLGPDGNPETKQLPKPNGNGQQAQDAALPIWLEGWFSDELKRQRQQAQDSDDEPRDEHGRWTSGSTLAGKIKISTKDPATMSNAELHKEHEKVSLHSSATGQELINAGRGMEKFQEIHAKPDELSQKSKALAERQQALYAEAEYRNRMGGRRVHDPETGQTKFVGKQPGSLKSSYFSVDAMIEDATPRTLYIRRQVLNGDVIRRWAKSQGFETVVDDDEMHVTIAYSKVPVDWIKVGEASPSYEPAGKAGEEQAWLVVPDGGPRLVDRFGDAVVLVFASSILAWRHEQAKQAGAAWDHPDYNPHVTISWNAAGMDLSKVVPYRGPIELGPEIFEEVDENYRAKIHEDAASDDEPRNEKGEWTAGGGTGLGRLTSTGYLKRTGHLAELEKTFKEKFGHDPLEHVEEKLKEKPRYIRVAGRRIRAYGPKPTKDAAGLVDPNDPYSSNNTSGRASGGYIAKAKQRDPLHGRFTPGHAGPQPMTRKPKRKKVRE